MQNFKDSLGLIPAKSHLVVAVSGGKDSMALLHLLQQESFSLHVVHINHHLRGAESDHDAAFVKDYCQKNQLAFTGEDIHLERGNMEAEAREKRYAILEDVRKHIGADYIALGHHEDDQVETILMHQERGAGLRGQRGMQVLSGTLFRPLLGVSQKEIEVYVEANNIAYVEDSSNKDTAIKRNKMRLEGISETAKKEALALSKAAQEVLSVLSAEAKVWLKMHAENGFNKAAFAALEQDLKSEIIIQLLGATDLYEKNILGLIDHIEKASNGKVMTLKGKTFVIEYDRVHIHEKAPEVYPVQELKKQLQFGAYTLKNIGTVKFFVRSWKSGDRFIPAGMQGSKKLQDYFVDQKVPRLHRHEVPVIEDDKGQIVCVGNRFDAHHEALKEVLKITL